MGFGPWGARTTSQQPRVILKGQNPSQIIIFLNGVAEPLHGWPSHPLFFFSFFFLFFKTQVPKNKNLKTQIPNRYLTLKLNFQFYAQWVGSNGKGICLGSIPIRFKVWIPLSANNSFGQWSWSLIRSLWRGCSAWVQIYLTWVDTRSDLELEGLLSLKQKSNFTPISLDIYIYIYNK